MKTNFRKGLQYLQPNRRHLGHKAWLGSGKGNGDEHAPIFTKKRANERPARNQQTGEAALEYEDWRLIPKYGRVRERELFAADKHSFRAAETGNDDAALFFLSLL